MSLTDTARRTRANLLAGLTVGAISTGLFNPWDRALYLSLITNRPFFHLQNWLHPWHGMSQTVIQKTLQGGLYFSLQAYFADLVHERFSQTGISPRFERFSVGLAAGLVNGLLMNQLATVKYYAWRRDRGEGFAEAARGMYQRGGIPPFFKGIHMTAMRDVVFGCAYELIRGFNRDLLEQWTQSRAATDSPHISVFWADMTAAGLATMLSGPFNYIRSVQYASSSEKPMPTTKECLVELWKDVRHQPSVIAQAQRMQQRMRIGWGTARVAIGMAFSQQVFEKAFRFWQEH